MHIVAISVHIAPLCAHMCACNHSVNYILCAVPSKDVMFQIWLKSDLIWLKYMIVHIVESRVHITPMCTQP